MAYVLEGKNEVERLEQQSRCDLYDYRQELEAFLPRASGVILDAGCGSGIVTRYLAQERPDLEVIGCDASPDRINGAKGLAAGQNGVSFVVANVDQLPFRDGEFGGALCRYVLEHLNLEAQARAVQEIYRCLRPGAWFCAIDVDGLIQNLYPRPSSMQILLERLQATRILDMEAGRKITSHFVAAGFESVESVIHTMHFAGNALVEEQRLVRERFDAAHLVIAQLVGSEARATEIETDFLAALARPESVLYYTKFIVMGRKPSPLLRSVR